MEEEARSSTSLYEFDSEEDEMRHLACRALVSMKYAILEPEQAKELSDLMKGNSGISLKKERSKSSKIPRNVNLPLAVVVDAQFPERGYSIDNTLLPQFPLLRELRNLIGVCSPPFEKQLTPTDVNANQSRISLNKAFVEAHYLQMLNADEKLDEGVIVTTYGPDGRGFEMNFKFWCKKTYVIKAGWKDFYQRYDLKAHTYWTTIWMFRHNVTDSLCFALQWKILPEYVGLLKRTKQKAGEA